MNEIYARRASQALMFSQTCRMLPTLWNATNVTKEPMDLSFVKEEFMRVNGHQQQHLLLGPVANQRHQHSHWNHLHNTLSWAESARAYSVSHHSPMTQRCADVARMHGSVESVRTTSTVQSLLLEDIARQEGVFIFEVDAATMNNDDDSSDTPEEP